MLAALIAGAYSFARAYEKDVRVRRLVQETLLKMPAIGSALRSAEVSGFARTLATLYASGVPIVNAIELAGMTTGNIPLREAAIDIKEQVANGRNLHEAMQLTGFFPSMVIHLIAVGDETGALDRMLDRSAEICEEAVDLALEAATAALEPMVLMFVGVLVGFVVIATMMPLLSVVQKL